MNRIVETFNDVIGLPRLNTFTYEVGQKVRVRSSLNVDTSGIGDLLGKEGVIHSRRHTVLHQEEKNEVKFSNGRIEPFDEEELDRRYIRKKK